VDIRQLRLSYGVSSQVTCAANLDVQGNLHATGTVTSSDRNIKTGIEDIDEAACMQMLKAVVPKTYFRTDLQNQTSRLGFLAQDIQENSHEKWGNLTAWLPGDEPRLGMDYARLTPLLWQCCRTLLTKIEALEGKKTKAASAKKTKE